MKMYTNTKTKMSVVSGPVLTISDDRKSITVKTQEFNNDSRKYEDKEIAFETPQPIAENVAVGKSVTVVGYEQIDMMAGTSKWVSGYVSAGNESFEFKTLAVVNGDVVYARYNEEKNEDGSPKMTKERMGADGKTVPSKPKTPHFDIGVSTMESDGEGNQKRVLHTVKMYPDPVKDKDGHLVDGQKNFDKIESMKKRFANFDKESNPMRVTIATQPGQISTSTKEYNGKVYDNTYSNHMGIYSIDIEYTKAREQNKEASNATPLAAEQEQAPVEATAPTPEPTQAPQAPQTDVPTPVVEDDMDELFAIN